MVYIWLKPQVQTNDIYVLVEGFLLITDRFIYCRLEDVENKEIQLQFPDIHLGAPPRSCYPLVLFLLDTTLLDASPTLLNEAHQIVSY